MAAKTQVLFGYTITLNYKLKYYLEGNHF